MKILNNLSVSGAITPGVYSNADLTAMGAPEHGLSSLIYNSDNSRYELWDGSAWIAVVPAGHPAAFAGTFGTHSGYLSIDATTQEVNLNIEEASLTSDLFEDTFYTTSEVDTKFSDLVGGAGAAYDTLQELATELQSNDADITTILSEIGNNDADIAALQAMSHDAVILATGSSTTLVLNGQELNLDLSVIEADIATNTADIATNTAGITSNDTDIAALQATSHDAVTIAAGSSVALTLNGQELELDLSGVNDLEYDSTSDTLSDSLGGSVVLSLVTATENGLMSAVDKEKLDFENYLAVDFATTDFALDPADANKYLFTVTNAKLTPVLTKSSLIIDTASGDEVIADVKQLSGSTEIRVNVYPDSRFAGRFSAVVSQV